MATKTEIKKWMKEILQPLIKPYNYKLGTDKEFLGGAYAIFKKTNIDFTVALIQIYSYYTVQLGSFNFTMIPLRDKLYEITSDKNVKIHKTLMKWLEIGPYYENIKKNDRSHLVPIKSKQQLEDYLQPLINKFPDNIKLIEHYKYIPNILAKWDEVAEIYDKTGDFQERNNYFPSPYKVYQVYFLARLINYKNSDKIFNHGILSYKSLMEKYKEENRMDMYDKYKNHITSSNKVKTYFNNLSQEDLEKLKEDFAPFLVKPVV